MGAKNQWYSVPTAAPLPVGASPFRVFVARNETSQASGPILRSFHSPRYVHVCVRPTFMPV